MTFTRPRAKALAGLALGLALLGTGCEWIQRYLPIAQATTDPNAPPVTIGSNGEKVNANVVSTNLGFLVRLPDSVGGLRGERIVATDPLDPESDISGSGAPVLGFRLAQAPANGTERPVQNASVFLRSYDMKVVAQLYAPPTDGLGKTFFRDVPDQVFFIADGQVLIGGQTLQLYGLARSGGVGSTAEVTLDVASTMAARQLLRLWQASNYQLKMRDVNPHILNPMVAFLRDAFRSGVPGDLGLDMTTITAPAGEPYNAANDRNDSALMAYDRLALRVPELAREQEVLRKAVNALLLPSGNPERGPIQRIPSMVSGGASPSPSPSADANATPSADPSATPSADASATPAV